MSHPPSIEFDIKDDLCHADVGREVVAVSLFMNDGRFTDLRDEMDLKYNSPMSTENCIPASLFLAEVLDEIHPSAGWTARYGRTEHSWHAFVVGHGGSIVADVTADQFGLAAAILKPLAEAYEYVIADEEGGAILKSHKAVDSGDHRNVSRWLRQWAKHKDKYRAMANTLITGMPAPKACDTLQAM